MTESTKALNSTVSTLKKNPGRLGRLVKAAKLLIVPSHQYTSGKAKKLVDEALKKLKAKRGLNGVTGEGAGPFSDKSLGIKKEAMEQKNKDRALAATAVTSGAALGGVLNHDSAKARTNQRLAIKGNARYTRTGESIETRLARSAKTQRRMAKPLRRAGIKGAIVGGLAGAALGAAHLKKEAGVDMKKDLVKEAASVLASRTVQQRAQQAFKHFKDKDLRVASLKSAAKKGAVAGAVVAGGTAVTKKNEQLKKQAAELVIKDGKKHRKGTVASAASKVGTAAGAVSALRGRNLKGVAKSVLKGGLVGGAYGTVRGANRLRKGEVSLSATEMHKLKSKGLSKKAAELIHHKGEAIRRGTIGSAAKKMAIGGGLAGAAGGAMAAGPVGAVAGGLYGAIQGGMLGGGYGLVRGALRAQDGEKSMTPEKFDKLKAKK